MFFKFIKNDLSYGFYRNRWKFLVTFLIFACLSSYHFLTLRIYEISHPEYFLVSPTVGDYLVTLIGGYGKYELNADSFELFTMPIVWLILVLWTQFTNLYYPFTDLTGFGKHLMVISGQRGAWWVSKCTWIIANTLAMCGVIFTACTATALFFGARFSMVINSYLPAELRVNVSDLNPEPWELTIFAIGAILVIICFALLQFTVSLVIKPLYAYLTLAAYAVASTYIQSPLLIGNYIMFARSSFFVSSGVDFMDGIMICSWLAVLSCAGGFLCFKKMDILGGDW